MEILRCSHLTKIYGSGSNTVTALKDVSFSLERGSFTAIIGASGSGKSTLLHMLGGVDRPTSGSIYIEDTDISSLGPEQLAAFRRRKVGLVYQFYNLIPTLNVRKNILLPVLLDNQQRVAIARSLIYHPAILLADEPTGNLDRKNSEETIELLKLSNRRYGQTILLITHDEKTALMADRVITLEDGKILHDEVVG